MNEKLKGYWEKCKEFLKKFPKKLYIAVLGGLVLVALIITVVLNTRPYSVLFTELSTDEASAIISYLGEQGITNYRLEGSDTILVPSRQENQLRAKLLAAGYPQSGFSYSPYYDNVGALSTEAERNQAYLIMVQERMGATIEALEGVKQAIVTITQGENRSFVLDSNNVVKASASVMVTMRDGRALDRNLANTIRNFVAHGVQGLEMEYVSVHDSVGNQFSGAADGAEAGLEASQLKLMLEQEYENKIRSEVLWAMEPFFGAENVRVSVNCTVDVNRVTSNSHDVYLPEWAQDGSTNGEGIIGSKIYEGSVVRGDNGAVGGVVGAESNSDLSTYVDRELDPDGTEELVSASGQTDYDNPKKDTYTEQVAGYITDCTVSVSINRTTAGMVDVEAFRPHVANAAGITAEQAADKISILPMAFYAPPALPGGITLPVEMWVVYVAGGGLLLLLVLIIIIIVSVKKKKRKKKQALLEEQQQQQLAMAGLAAAVNAAGEPMGADVMEMQTERSMELRKDIRKFVDDNPEIAAQMVKSWLRGGEEDG